MWDDRMDKPREECGVFGIFAPGEDVARITFFGLYALQHRGQESAGIATSDGRDLFVHTSLGLVNRAFEPGDLERLPGRSRPNSRTVASPSPRRPTARSSPG